MNSRFLMLVAALLAMPGIASAREQIRIVGSSTVFPFVAAAAEQFGHGGTFRTPIVESTGTGGGIKMFCDGVGMDTPDMANASRPIKDSEIAQCKAHGVTSITELRIGFDGIVFANARPSPAMALTRRTLFLALARDVPKGGKLVPNFYTKWKQIDPALPDTAIEVYGPPPTSGTRDAFAELVMAEGCKLIPEIRAAHPKDDDYKHQCMTLREDGVFIEAGEDDNLIVQKLVNNATAVGIFGYSFLESNAALVKANAVDGVEPSFEAIIHGDYHVARSLYVYVKNQHVGQVPGLAEFARALTADAATGEDGYLIVKGLLPLTKPEHEAMKKVAAGI